MKKTLLIPALLLIVNGAIGQTTATNFTANDCSSNSHTLFSELESGKVIVISFVMPCGTCIAPTLAADAAVQSFASSNPGQVLLYVSDDLGTTACNTVTGWESTNSISSDATFSNTGLKMSQYGSGTMNRVVVLGGMAHKVYYNVGSGVTQANIESAITTALGETGINDAPKADFQLKVFPNPATEKLSVSYTLKQFSDVKLEVLNILGEKVKEIKNEKQSAGQHDLFIDTENLTAGIYFVKVTSEDSSQFIKFTVAR